MSEKGMPFWLTYEERDTVLAALRLWQGYLYGEVLIFESEQGAALEKIASGDDNVMLEAEAIDALCERINI
jgi:hypothetical protein